MIKKYEVPHVRIRCKTKRFECEDEQLAPWEDQEGWQPRVLRASGFGLPHARGAVDFAHMPGLLKGPLARSLRGQ